MRGYCLILLLINDSITYNYDINSDITMTMILLLSCQLLALPVRTMILTFLWFWHYYDSWHPAHLAMHSASHHFGLLDWFFYLYLLVRFSLEVGFQHLGMSLCLSDVPCLSEVPRCPSRVPWLYSYTAPFHPVFESSILVFECWCLWYGPPLANY